MLGDHTRLTSSEISSMWSTYLNNSLSVCILQYFLANTDDPEIKPIVQFALDMSEYNLNMSREILLEDKQPEPVGFTSEDVSPTAPRLYSDTFYLYYLENMAKVGPSVYGVALTGAARGDVRDFLSQAIQKSTEMYNKVAELLLSKGLYVRPPYVSTSDTVDFVDSKKYLGGLMDLNNNNRPLNVVEISHLEANSKTNAIGSTLLTAFAQVAKSKKVRNYCTTGKEIAKKHVQVFTNLLTKDELPSPGAWDLEVTGSTVAPFSDKLIMYHTTTLITSGLSNYTTASAASFRTDLQATYARLTLEVTQYASDGLNIMIKNKWLEQPPQIPDHKKLAKD